MSQALLTGLSRTHRPWGVVRRFLVLDAVVTGGNGVVYAVAPGAVGELLGVGRGLLLGVGVFLLVFAGGVGWLARRERVGVGAVKAVVDVNVGWVVLSGVALVGWLEPTTAGAVWILLQAGTVAGFAGLQWAALRAAAGAGG
ncbi:hypothetical protein ACF065_04300 [Streptomyces sp. NPDC015232]|uniref:hypothetical protein n=1 Tax=unclassified Streptomyces TaxID=2593676 RepID=UPI0036FFF17B